MLQHLSGWGGGEKYNMFAGIFHYFRGGGNAQGNRDVYLSPLTKTTSHHGVFQRGSISIMILE